MIWVRHSGGPPFRGCYNCCYNCYIVIITLTLTPGSPEWRTSGMAGRYPWYAVCSRWSTRRHDSSTICDRTTTSLMRWRHCTGFASQNDSVPRYLGPLVAVADLPGRRALRSASTSLLVAPPIKLSTVGSRAFSVAAAQVWHGLPEAVVSSSSLQTFRRQLTHLFQRSYPRLIF